MKTVLPERLSNFPNDLFDLFSALEVSEAHKLFFFGSRISGTNRERSDLDIGIEGLTQVPTSSMLQLVNFIEEYPTLIWLTSPVFLMILNKG